MVADVTYIGSGSFMIDVALGKVPGHSIVNGYGILPGIGTNNDPETIWSGAGLWAPTLQPRQASIVSSSTDDAPGGTGARTFAVTGLNGATGKFTTEILSFAGQTPVLTVSSWLYISDITVLTTGSAGGNVGTITAVAETESLLQAQINPGINTSHNGFFQCPGQSRAIVLEYYAGISLQGQKLGGCDIVFEAQVDVVTAPWVQVETISLEDSASVNVHHQQNNSPGVFSAGTRLRPNVVGPANMSVFVGWGFLVVEDGY